MRKECVIVCFDKTFYMVALAAMCWAWAVWNARKRVCFDKKPIKSHIVIICSMRLFFFIGQNYRMVRPKERYGSTQDGRSPLPPLGGTIGFPGFAEYPKHSANPLFAECNSWQRRVSIDCKNQLYRVHFIIVSALYKTLGKALSTRHISVFQ